MVPAAQVIHHFVEVLDRYFGNVCELDLIFNFHKARQLFCTPCADLRFVHPLSVCIMSGWTESSTSTRHAVSRTVLAHLCSATLIRCCSFWSITGVLHAGRDDAGGRAAGALQEGRLPRHRGPGPILLPQLFCRNLALTET